MEQPNMMGNGMAPQNMNMNSMQRPQSGNLPQQVYAKIMDDLRNQPGQPVGWQATFDMGQRASRIMQLFSGLRVLNGDYLRCLQTAENFEKRTFFACSSKQVYVETMDNKMNDILAKRQATAQQLLQPGQLGMSNGNQIGMNNGNMGMSLNNMPDMNNMQNNGMGGMGMGMSMNMNMNMNTGMNMANNGMSGMPNGQMGVDGVQQTQNFPTHLQRQMQPSPLPQQQQQPQQQQNNTMDPSALHNPQMQPQMANMNQTMMQQPQPNVQGGQMQQSGAQTVDALATAQAKKMYTGMSEEERNAVRAQFLAHADPKLRQALTSQAGDPLFKVMLQKSKDNILRQRAGQINQGDQQNNGGVPMGNNMSMQGTDTQQTPVSQAGGTNIDFGSIMGQQANAIKSKESGIEVVPASNNANFNAGGQANMAQGVNPQVLNQNNQNGGNPQLNMRFMAMQQDKQRQELMQKQNQMAQQQALAQQKQAQNQLRGQPGGLNTPNALNGGQVNSPAMDMNMLTRPMLPPGQATPATPQQNRPQGMRQTPVNPANQLAQHHQSMLNQNNQAMNQNPMQWFATLPPATQERFKNLPPQQMGEMMRYLANRNAQNGSAMNNQPGMPGMQPNMNMGGPQMGSQPSVGAGMPNNVGNAVPGFNSQPPPNQQLAQQSQQSMTMQQMARVQQQHLRGKAMDMRPFPRDVLGNLGVQVAPEVETWAKLREYITTNQAVLPPNTLNKLQAAQNQWFETHPEEANAAMTFLNQRLRAAQQASQGQQPQPQPQQQQQVDQNRPPSSMAMPNGQAPPAQMVPPMQQPTMQQPPNQIMGGPIMNQGQMRMPQLPPTTDAEVKSFREKFPEQTGKMTDENVKVAIMRHKQSTMARSSMQMQQSLRNAQIRSAQALANGGQPGAPQQQQQQQQQQAQVPPQAPMNQNQQGNNQLQGQGQGQKRPQTSNDDVIEIPNPAAAANGMPQPPAMQQNMSQQGPQGRGNSKMPTREELDRMNPQQKLMFMTQMKQYEALRKANMGIANTQGGAPVRPPQQPPSQQQQQPQPQPQQMPAQPQQQANQQQAQGIPATPSKQQLEDLERVKAMLADVARNNPKGPPISVNAEDSALAQSLLKRLWNPMMNLDRTWVPALRAPGFGETRIRSAMRAKLIIQQNTKDANGTFKDYLSVTPLELKKLEHFVGLYFHELKSLRERNDAARALAQPAANGAQAQQTQAQQAQPKQPAKPEQPQPAPPLNRKQSQQGHGRKASAANKAPPAPTENKTFDWGVQSPHGVPKYDPARNELTPDKLKMPQTKRRKTGHQTDSQSSTPAAQTGTPGATAGSPAAGVVKAPSPEQLKKIPPQAKVVEPPRPKFKCDDLQCDSLITGFETEEQLKEHKDKIHQPIEDPLKFLLDNTIDLPKLEIDSKLVPAANNVKAPQPRGKPTPVAKVAVKKEVQTPQVKQETATPGSTGKTSAKSAAKKSEDAKAPDSAIDVKETERTFLDAMAENLKLDLPTPDIQVEAPATTAEDSWTDLLSNVFDESTNSFSNDWSDFPTGPNADWGFPPHPDDSFSSPELTPSNSDTSQSSRESDITRFDRLRINMAWDAFGNGDTYVPEFLRNMEGLGLEPKKDGEDVAANVGDGSGAEQKVEGPMDWSSDMLSWETFLGRRAERLND